MFGIVDVSVTLSRFKQLKYGLRLLDVRRLTEQKHVIRGAVQYCCTQYQITEGVKCVLQFVSK